MRYAKQNPSYPTFQCAIVYRPKPANMPEYSEPQSKTFAAFLAGIAVACIALVAYGLLI